MTFKAIRYYNLKDLENKKEVIHWLKYWVFYSALLNIETQFSFTLREFYTPCKIILILNCLPIKNGLLDYFYSLIFSFFLKHKGFRRKLINEEEDEENQNFGDNIHRNINEGITAIKFIKKIT